MQKFENYSVAQLEDIISQLYRQERKQKKWGRRKVKKEIKEISDELEQALYERKYKLDETFEWTPENCEKLLLLNQQLIECWEKLDAEAKQTLEIIVNRIKNPDDFLTSFDMSAKIEVDMTYFYDEDDEDCDDENSIVGILIDSIERHVNYFRFGLNGRYPVVFIDKKHNLNHNRKFEEKFNDHFISQAIHDLYDHTYLSFSDILKINELLAELHIEYKHSRSVEPKK